MLLSLPCAFAPPLQKSSHIILDYLGMLPITYLPFQEHRTLRGHVTSTSTVQNLLGCLLSDWVCLETKGQECDSSEIRTPQQPKNGRNS